MIKRYRYILLPLVSGLIIVSVTVSFALPKLRTIVALKKSLKKEKNELSSLTEKAALLEGLNEYELKQKVVRVEMALPSRKVVAEILAALSSISSESGVSFIGLEISPGELIPGKFDKVGFKATFDGSTDDLKVFLRRIREVLPLMKVISLKVGKEKITLEMESYFSSPPESLGKIDTPLPKISEAEEKAYQKIAQFESFEGKLPSVPVGKEDPFSSF